MLARLRSGGRTNCSAHAAGRSASRCSSHVAIWFQLVKVWSARSTVGTARGEPERYRARRRVLWTRTAGIRRPTLS